MYPATQEQWANLENRTGRDNTRRVKAEQAQVRKLVRAALKRGWLVSVYDSEEWAIKKSSNFTKIMDAANNTDEDTFVFRDTDGNKLGQVYLVYGNGPEDIVCDFTLDTEPFLKEIGLY